MFIAVDDTDSREGMCTTFLATELIREFDDFDLLDYPRLVRLNPNVPWKTRGNGAIVITIGYGKRKNRKIGNLQGEVYIHEEDTEIPKKREFLERVKRKVEQWAELDNDNTNPGLIIADERPSERFYRKAVRDVVDFEMVQKELDRGSYLYKGYDDRRGLVGALSALAWRPGDFTYELLTYRKKDRWGKERELNEKDIINMDGALKKAFDNYDHEEKEQAIAPNSPCPVLYGVRGEDPDELKQALKMIDGEKPERWLIFLTNQATDDHIQEKKISEASPWTSAKIGGKVISEPRIIEGGHILFEMEDVTGKITAAAYEPTKGFREVVKKLISGDKIELWGGIRKDPKTLNIEKMRILGLEEKVEKVSNPECPDCGKRMSSMGTNAGYRCKRCRTKAKEKEAERKKIERGLEETCYEVPVSARRHLSKPLTRDNTCRSTSRRSS